jgi:hypothetical protein
LQHEARSFNFAAKRGGDDAVPRMVTPAGDPGVAQADAYQSRPATIQDRRSMWERKFDRLADLLGEESLPDVDPQGVACRLQQLCNRCHGHQSRTAAVWVRLGVKRQRSLIQGDRVHPAA